MLFHSRPARRACLYDLIVKPCRQGHYFSPFRIADTEVIQHCSGVAGKNGPVALADGKALVRRPHIPSAVVNRSAGNMTEEVNQQLEVSFSAVLTFSLPEHADLRIGMKPAQQFVRDCSDRIVPT